MHNLLVCREEQHANLIKKGLLYENICTDITLNEKECLAQILRSTYDAVIIKDTPPDIDALSLCKRVRSMHSNIPILIFDPQKTTEEELFEAGATGIITPPLSLQTLTRALKNIFSQQLQKNEKKEIQTNHLILNLETRKITRDNRSILLRNKEFVLMEYLMRNAGKVLNRNTMLEHIWDHNINILTNTVDVHISKLRKKIDQGYKKKLIETIHCVGYRLNDE